MNDDELRRRYQAGLARRVGGDPRLTLEQLEALVEHRLPEDEAVAALDRVMAEEGLRREYELLRSIRAAREAGASNWIKPTVLALAAGLAAIVAITSLRGIRDDASTTMRGAESAVQLRSPAGGSTARVPVLLAWAPVEGATSYRVELVNDAGATVLTRQTPDTAITLLPEDGLPPAAYRWWVKAEVPAGQVRSEFREVRLQAP